MSEGKPQGDPKKKPPPVVRQKPQKTTNTHINKPPRKDKL